MDEPWSSKPILPYEEAVERAVLGAVLIDPEATMERLHHRLAPEDFYITRHQVIWRAMAALWATKVLPDLLTVQAELTRIGALDVVGGVAYLTKLDLDLPDLGRVDLYADVIRECASRRRLIAVSQVVIKDSLNGGTAQGILARLEAAVEAEVAGLAKPAFRDFGEVMDNAFRMVEEGGVPGLPWTLSRLNEVTGGMKRGTLISIAGRPGHGKSTLAAQEALAQARAGRHVAYFSLEMDAEFDMGLRFLAAASDVPYKWLAHRAALIPRGDWPRLAAARDALKEQVGGRLYIDERSGISAEEVIEALKALRRQGRVDVAYVDHAGLLGRGPRRFDSETLLNQHRGQIFKQAAKELGIPVVLLLQLSRESERRSDPRPLLSDLRYGGWEQDLDLAVFLHRQELHDGGRPGEVEIILGKNRQGEIGMPTTARFVGPTYQIEEMR